MAQKAFGDIFYVETPAIDKAGALLYNQQKQREQQIASEANQLDELMKKEFAGVRSADIQDISQKWNNYKGLKKQILFNRDLQKDQTKFIEAQKAANQQLADIQESINASKQYKETLDGLRKDYLVRSESYDDNAGQMMAMAMQTPLSQLRNFRTGLQDPTGAEVTLDFTNPETFRYKGTDYDPFPDLDKLRGGKVTREIFKGAVSPTSVEDKFEVYNFFERTPLEYKERFRSMLAGDRKANKFYLSQLEQTPIEDIKAVQAQYDAIPEETFKKLGLKKDKLDYQEGMTRADIAATYMAQKYALENSKFLSQASKEEFRENKERKRLQDISEWDRRQAIRDKNALNRAFVVSQGKNEYVPEYHIDAIFEEGDDKIGHITVGGKKIEGKRVTLPDEVSEKLMRDLGKYKEKPSYYYMSNDMQSLYPVYETGEKTKSGNPIIDTKEGEKISVSTGLIPQLSKTFGGQAFTKKSIFTSPFKKKETAKPKKDPLGLF